MNEVSCFIYNRHREVLRVVLLKMPAIAQWIEGRRISATEKRSRANHTIKSEHFVFLQKFEEIVNGWDVDVIDRHDATWAHMGVEVVVIQFWERIAMGTVDQDKIELFGIFVCRDGLLTEPFDKNNIVLFEEFRVTSALDTATEVSSECVMLPTAVGKDQS